MVKRKLNKMDNSIQSNSELSDFEKEESEFSSSVSKCGVKDYCTESEASDSENEPLIKKSKIAPKKQDSMSEDFEKGSSEIISAESSDDDTINSKKQSSKKNVKRLKNTELDTSDSDNEVVQPKSRNDSLKEHSSLKKSESASSNMNSSEDELEPLSKLLNAPDIKGDIDSKSISSSESDDEPVVVKKKKNSAKSTTVKDEKSELKKNEHGESSADEKRNMEESDSDLDFKPLKKKTKIQSAPNRQPKKESDESCESSGDEEEPLSKLQNNASIKTSRNSKSATSYSDSDDEPLAIKTNKKSPKGLKKTNSEHSVGDSSDNVEPPNEVSKILDTKKQELSILSEDEFLETKSKKISQKKSKANKQVKKKPSSEENNDISSDEDKPLSKIAAASRKKAKNSSNDKIEHLKKYVRAAGIHITSYDKFFEGCKSIKSKSERLLDMLHEKGIKGRPTLEKCKKLKKKIETKKEVAELDVSNIITSEGRSKRNSNRDTLQSTENIECSPARKKFSRLQDIIDSEDSN